MIGQGNPRQAEGVRMLPKGKSVFVVAGEEAYEFGYTETFLWSLCTGENSIADMAGELSRRFEIQEEVADRDTREFIGQLREAGLVEW